MTEPKKATVLEEYAIELLTNVDVIVQFDSDTEYARGYLAGMKSCYKLARRWRDVEVHNERQEEQG